MFLQGAEQQGNCNAMPMRPSRTAAEKYSSKGRPTKATCRTAAKLHSIARLSVANPLVKRRCLAAVQNRICKVTKSCSECPQSSLKLHQDSDPTLQLWPFAYQGVTAGTGNLGEEAVVCHSHGISAAKPSSSCMISTT